MMYRDPAKTMSITSNAQNSHPWPPARLCQITDFLSFVPPPTLSKIRRLIQPLPHWMNDIPLFSEDLFTVHPLLEEGKL
jgi:hypothetical protein